MGNRDLQAVGIFLRTHILLKSFPDDIVILKLLFASHFPQNDI